VLPQAPKLSEDWTKKWQKVKREKKSLFVAGEMGKVVPKSLSDLASIFLAFCQQVSSSDEFWVEIVYEILGGTVYSSILTQELGRFRRRYYRLFESTR
jgi:hypothetical protein